MGETIRVLAFLLVIVLFAVPFGPRAEAQPAPIREPVAPAYSVAAPDPTEAKSVPAPTVTPPVTQIEIRGTFGPNNNGWYVTPVLVILRATDDVEVTSTFYRMNSGTYQLYGLPFAINDDRNHTLEFFSLDREGNAETQKSTRVPVDRNPPAFVDLRPQGTVTSNNVLLEWTAQDPGSGVARSQVSVDGGQILNVGSESSRQVQLSDGRHTVRVVAHDVAGNNASTEYAFLVDTSFLSVTGPQGTLLLALIVGVNAAAVFAVLILRRRRRP